MVTDFLFDGFRFALKAAADPGIAHERSFAFAGDALARSLSALSPDALAAGYQPVVLGPDADGARLPRDPADRRALPHRHRAAHALLPPRRAGEPGADRRSRSDHGRRRRGGHEDRRAHRARSHLEGRARRVHVHRMRPLQGRLPHLSHRQAAGAEMGLRRPQAAPACSSATAIVARRRRGAAAARPRRHRAGRAVGVHDLRLLRGGLPDRARAPAAILPHAPAPGDDGRRVPARAQGGVRRLRRAEQPVGTAGRHARRLGARARRSRRADRPTTCGSSTTSSTSARRSRSIRARRRWPPRS